MRARARSVGIVAFVAALTLTGCTSYGNEFEGGGLSGIADAADATEEAEPTDEAAPTVEADPTEAPEPTEAADPTEEADPTDPTETVPFTLLLGACLNADDLAGDVLATPETIPCDEPHDSEVYVLGDAQDGDYPGEDVLFADIASFCQLEFPAFVGIDYDQSTLDYLTLGPTEADWAIGDRRVWCVLVDPAGPFTGTLEGAAR